MGVNYLINTKGHSRIAYVGGISHSLPWLERMDGYKQAHEDANLKVDDSLILESAPTREGGMLAIQKIMNQPNPPKAIFCFNDLTAFGAIIGLRKMGYSPGKDIDIVGFDNIPETEISYPPLTTISSFAQNTGKEAATLLHQRITEPNREKQRVVIEPELVKRESS